MIYSDPITFDGSSLQAKIFGIGTVVIDRTETRLVKHLDKKEVLYHHINSRYAIVATSELVTILEGPATDIGILATRYLPLSVEKTNARLYPPSILL